MSSLPMHPVDSLIILIASSHKTISIHTNKFTLRFDCLHQPVGLRPNGHDGLSYTWSTASFSCMLLDPFKAAAQKLLCLPCRCCFKPQVRASSTCPLDAPMIKIKMNQIFGCQSPRSSCDNAKGPRKWIRANFPGVKCSPKTFFLMLFVLY